MAPPKKALAGDTSTAAAVASSSTKLPLAMVKEKNDSVIVTINRTYELADDGRTKMRQ